MSQTSGVCHRPPSTLQTTELTEAIDVATNLQATRAEFGWSQTRLISELRKRRGSRELRSGQTRR